MSTAWGEVLDETQPPLRGEVRTEVCVVGLGAAGLSAIGRLRAAGVDAIGIDAGRIGGGASGRNGGFLLAGAATFHHETVRRHGRSRAVALHALTLAELERTATALPGIVRRTGSIRLATDSEEMADCERHREALVRDGFAAEPYDGPEGRGIFLPDDGAFDPVARCRALADPLIDAGVPLYENSPAVEVTGESVATNDGVITCASVLVCVDGRLERLLPELEGRVRTARAQMLATGPAPPLTDHPVYARHGLDYWQQLPDGRVVLGGARDKGGDDEWTDDPRPSAPVQDELDRLLDRLGVEAPVTHRWAGLIGYTGDGLPVVEEVRPSVFACGAYSGTGNVLAPLAGRAIADLATGRRSEVAELIGSDRDASTS